METVFGSLAGFNFTPLSHSNLISLLNGNGQSCREVVETVGTATAEMHGKAPVWVVDVMNSTDLNHRSTLPWRPCRALAPGP